MSRYYVCRGPVRDFCVRPGLRIVRIVICNFNKKGGPRNILVEDIETGERWVRPFRGIRRWRGEKINKEH